MAELLLGVELADDEHRETRRAYVDDVLSTIPVLPYDARVAAAHAGLLASVRRAGRPRGAHDLIIAATAIASDRSVISADADGFTGLPGLDIIRQE